ncbi:hypothetical protein RRG08_020425 [Elysia crispata]|uniref:Uncharacterized protein n=1 Tax=Elysia crispata TaxID=231223 RepID=A0AAE1B5N9_9GAST|nr:hypothetical protein RRG08_020425 [Elysia crispata]
MILKYGVNGSQCYSPQRSVPVYGYLVYEQQAPGLGWSIAREVRCCSERHAPGTLLHQSLGQTILCRPEVEICGTKRSRQARLEPSPYTPCRLCVRARSRIQILAAFTWSFRKIATYGFVEQDSQHWMRQQKIKERRVMSVDVVFLANRARVCCSSSVYIGKL